MKSRRFQRGEWSFAVGIPDSVARRIRPLARRKRRAPAGEGRVVSTDAHGRSLVFADPPPLNIVKQDPQEAIDAFVASGPPRQDGADPSPAEWWYHTIELPGGRVTEGVYDHRPLVPHYGLPDDMSGMRALDVGTSDGFWAFEMERRGADVVGLDLPRMSDRDFPPEVKAVIRERYDAPPGQRFEFARRTLGSGVEHVELRVYDVDPQRLGKFDFVHVGDILQHLRDPAAALAAVHSVTAGRAHISDAVVPRIADETYAHLNLATYHGGWGMTHWWTPSAQTLAQMTLDAGFADVDVVGLYRLDVRGAEGLWRLILSARA